MKKLVVVGSGMSAMSVVDKLLSIHPSKYQITIIGEENYLPYNRIMLSSVLSKEKAFQDTVTHSKEYFNQNNITFKQGVKVIDINRLEKCAILSNDEILYYDRLVLCTGSVPFILPIPGNDIKNVVSFRNINDVNFMQSMSAKKAVVIGSGLLGLEAAHGLNESGFLVTVISNVSHIMDRQLDLESSQLLQQSLEQKGIKFRFNLNAKEIHEKYNKVSYIKFESGDEIIADLVVMAVGIVPNDSLAEGSGVLCKKGIVVNDLMQTFDPAIYSVGECVNHRGNNFGLIAPLFEQARVCAEQLAEKAIHRFSSADYPTKLKISGVDVFSVGDFTNEKDEVLISFDDTNKIRKRLTISNNILTSAVLVGDSSDGFFYEELTKNQTDISNIRKTLLFGNIPKNTAETGNVGEMMADDDQVCGCLGVVKSDIVNAVKKGCNSFSKVKEETGCATGCGGCADVAKQIFEFAIGEQSVEKETLCACTNQSSADIREYIRTLKSVKTIEEVRKELQFSDACETCGNAINYYLYSQFNDKYAHSSKDRPHNEMMHANLQNDGTYSIVPQMQGGLTTPSELKALADIAVKYKVPTVKVTGGQRIDLLGIAKDKLKPMWKEIADAGMESGYAYGKATRTCKSCVGKDHCLMGTQDSMGLAVKMEDAVWSHFMPHKFKMGVSGCPRNCAEATIKDFGVICTEKGYEIHVAGACGIRTKACLKDRFFETEDEVVEYLQAFVQLYREEANYLERVMHFEERVGLDYIQGKLKTAEQIQFYSNRLPETTANPWTN
ncbi:MAG: NAD(P)/FAD-dependent oxidoreductase [Candidatus Thioglobus sp.]|nr:MAG: NAD(P)/FAD-dependent oxidoreductase [Candidatus Thioglobus sp.]